MTGMSHFSDKNTYRGRSSTGYLIKYIDFRHLNRDDASAN